MSIAFAALMLVTAATAMACTTSAATLEEDNLYGLTYDIGQVAFRIGSQDVPGANV